MTHPLAPLLGRSDQRARNSGWCMREPGNPRDLFQAHLAGELLVGVCHVGAPTTVGASLTVAAQLRRLPPLPQSSPDPRDARDIP